jgi:hypothetical protein
VHCHPVVGGVRVSLRYLCASMHACMCWHAKGARTCQLCDEGCRHRVGMGIAAPCPTTVLQVHPYLRYTSGISGALLEYSRGCFGVSYGQQRLQHTPYVS